MILSCVRLLSETNRRYISTIFTIVSFFRHELTLAMNRVSKEKLIINTNSFVLNREYTSTGVFVECNMSGIVEHILHN